MKSLEEHSRKNIFRTAEVTGSGSPKYLGQITFQLSDNWLGLNL